MDAVAFEVEVREDEDYDGHIVYKIFINGNPVDGYADELYARHMSWLLKFLHDMHNLQLEFDAARKEEDQKAVDDKIAEMRNQWNIYPPFLNILQCQQEQKQDIKPTP